MKPEYIVLHHSLTKDSKTVSWPAIRKYHVQRMEFFDIGYHFGIEMVGAGDKAEILLGRLWNRPGAHAKQRNMNSRSIGICFVGNFDDKPPPACAWEKGIKLCSTLMETFAIPSIKVIGHREVCPTKSCPGHQFDLIEFRRRLFQEWITITKFT